MKKGAADNIKQKISELQGAMANGDESLIQAGINALMSALSSAYDS